MTDPSPSRVMAVSASTRSTSPTVEALSEAWPPWPPPWPLPPLQSMPSRQDSSWWVRPSRETTTRYRVRPACALSSFTACRHRAKVPGSNTATSYALIPGEGGSFTVSLFSLSPIRLVNQVERRANGTYWRLSLFYETGKNQK